MAKKKIIPSESNRTQMFIDTSKEGIDYYFEAFTSLDTKAGIMISVIAIILSFGFRSKIFILDFAQFISSAITIIGSFLVIRVRELQWGINIIDLRKKSEGKYNLEVLNDISAGKEMAYLKNVYVYEEKVAKYKFTEHFFILTLTIFFIITLIGLVMPDKQPPPPSNPPSITTTPISSINFGEPSPKATLTPTNPPASTTTPISTIHKGTPTDVVKK